MVFVPPPQPVATASAPRSPMGAKSPPNLETRLFREMLGTLAHGSKPDRPEGGPARREGRPVAEEAVAEPAPPRGSDREAPGHGESDDGEREARGSEPEPAGMEPHADPIFRALAHAGPRLPPPAETLPAPNAALLPELERLLTRLVKRAAWGGDGRRGTARLELGAGPLEGATLLVQADGGEVSIDLELPAGAAAGPWRERLFERLSARGLVVRDLTVR
jgi:hypothetical protein